MRKKIIPDKICSDCGTILKHGQEEYFCDVCKERVGENWLGQQISIFFKDGIDSMTHTDHYDVCSWKCVAEWLNNLPLNKDKIDFITIPYLSSHGTSFSKRLDEFLEAFKN